MFLYNQLMECIIYEDSTEEYKNRKNQNINSINKKFLNDFKITYDVLNNNINIFNIIKTKEDFNKMIKSTGTSLCSDNKKLILSFYSDLYFDQINHDNYTESDILKAIENDSNNDNKYKKDAVEFIKKSDKMIPLQELVYYCLQDKKIYILDYKGRVKSSTVDDYLKFINKIK